MRRGLQRRLQNLEEISGFRYTAENPRVRRRIVVDGLAWTPIPGRPGSWSMPPPDLEKSICSRTLYADGTLEEWVEIYGSREELSTEEMEQWIARQPVERFEIRQLQEHHAM